MSKREDFSRWVAQINALSIDCEGKMKVRTRFLIYRMLRRLFIPHKLAYRLVSRATKAEPIIESGWARRGR